jgi:hypothetical protein
MKGYKSFGKDVHEDINRDPESNAQATCINSKTGRNLKKFFYIAGIAGLGLLFNGCRVGYIANEPTYVEYTRPASPGNDRIWRDGDWAWNRQTHVYVQRAGFWEKPNQRRSYTAGHWQSNPRGQYWVRGSWQKQKHQGNKNKR